MPNRKKLSRAYQADHDGIVFGPSNRNCHYRHFSSVELTKTWGQGSQDATIKQAMAFDPENK